MQIIIDTAKDTKEELRKLAKFLGELSGEQKPDFNVSDEATNGMTALFEIPEKTIAPEANTKAIKTSPDIIINDKDMDDKEDEDKYQGIEIIPY